MWYTQIGCNITQSEKWNNAICSNMDAGRHDPDKWRKSERQILYDIPSMWNLRWDTHELIHKTETDSQSTDVWFQGGQGGGGKDWELGICRCKRFCKWINITILLYSTGNYSQYPTTNHHGKEYKKYCMHLNRGITFLYSRNSHDIVHQLCFHKNNKSTFWKRESS